MPDPSFELRVPQSGPNVVGTPGHVLTFDANGRSVSGQPLPSSGGISPLEVHESCITDFLSVTSADVYILKQSGGVPIQCDFVDWNPGDILRATFFATFRVFGAPSISFLYAAVSDDAWVTQLALSPCFAAYANPGFVEPAECIYSNTASGSVALATKPSVRIALQDFLGGFECVPDEHSTQCLLRCERFAAGSYTPAGSLIT